jgi:hypothetical protein
MNRRVSLAGITVAIALLLAVVAVGAVGCGPKGSATTTSGPQTSNAAGLATATTGAVTATTGAVTTTSATAPSALSSPLGRTTTTESQQYLTQMLAFGQALADLPVTDDPSNFTDVAGITSAELEAAGKYVSGVQSAIALLKAIQPPAKIAEAHQKVVAAMEALAAATDKLLTAAQNKDQDAFDAAQGEGRAAVQTLQTAMQELRSLLGGGGRSN